MVANAEQWTVVFQPQAETHFRLFCFPYAGAGAVAYRTWGTALPQAEVCAIRLPGRETRLREEPYTRMEPLVAALTDALLPMMDAPFAFFGHSMGSVLSFEVARRLRQLGYPLPLHLFASAWPAPQIGRAFPPISTLPDTDFVKGIQQRYGGIPAAILAEPDLLQIFIPILRADLSVMETYRYAAEPPLPCSISAYGGDQDTATTPDTLSAWGEQTTDFWDTHFFQGGHFYLQSQQSVLLRQLHGDLDQVLQLNDL
ncbi:MAG: thioesterase [Anaerolineaceae bacterium]|nr:thioesterase [Anaerolineaceae bacterium]